MSFRISISPSRRAATRFIADVRRELQEAFAHEETKGNAGISQADVARAVGVNRSVINRELRGHANISIGRIAELAWALGRKPVLFLEDFDPPSSSNAPTRLSGATEYKISVSAAHTTREIRVPERVDA